MKRKMKTEIIILVCLGKEASGEGGSKNTGMFVWGTNTRMDIESYRKRKGPFPE